MATHRLSTTVTTSSGTVVTNGPTYTNDGSQSYSLAIADSAPNTLVNISLTVADITSMIISSDQDCLLETNHATTPIDMFTIPANDAVIWNTDSLYTNLLTTDVTAMYFTNTSGSVANIEMRFLYDSTP